jgi:hypothetical protein
LLRLILQLKGMVWLRVRRTRLQVCPKGAKGEVVVVVLAGYGATMNLVETVVAWVEGAVEFEGKREWVVGRVDFLR